LGLSVGLLSGWKDGTDWGLPVPISTFDRYAVGGGVVELQFLGDLLRVNVDRYTSARRVRGREVRSARRGGVRVPYDAHLLKHPAAAVRVRRARGWGGPLIARRNGARRAVEKMMF